MAGTSCALPTQNAWYEKTKPHSLAFILVFLGSQLYRSLKLLC